MNSYFWFSCISSDHDSAEGFDLDSTLKTIFSSSQTLKHNMLERGVLYSTGENLIVVWAVFSTLSWTVLLLINISVLVFMQLASFSILT